MTLHLAVVEDTILNGKWAQVVLAQGCDAITKMFTSGELGKCQGMEEHY